MAINLSISNNTAIHRFDLPSHRLSIQTESKINDADADDCPRFQDTVPLDSPSMDDHYENIDFNTEVLYDSDYDDRGKNSPALDNEEEIVLDSEDEKINGSRVVTIANSSHGSVIKKRIKGNALETNSNARPVFEYPYAGNGTGLECDRKISKLNENITIEETEEWSQTDAIDFVDRFVSNNIVDNMSQEICCRKNFRQKLPSVLGMNGPQNLARKIYTGAQAKGQGPFEWFDNEGMEYSRKDVKSVSDIGGRKQNGVPHLIEEIRWGLDRLESGFAVNSARERREMPEVSEASTPINETELTGKQSEDNAIVRESFDIYDIGFNTQLAAEAIEELAYANPFGYRSTNACQDEEKTLINSLGGVLENDSPLKRSSIQMSICKDIGEILHRATRKKRSDRKLGGCVFSSSRKQSVIQEVDPVLTTTGTRLCCGMSANVDGSSGTSPPKPSKLSKEKTVDKKGIAAAENNMIPLTTVETRSLANVQVERQFKKVYSRTWRHRRSGSGVWLKTADKQACNLREKINGNAEHGITVYRRKRSRVNANSLGVSSIIESSKPCDSSEAARKSNMTSSSKFGVWNCPRGKRTSYKVRKKLGRDFDLNAPFSSHYPEKRIGKADVKENVQSIFCTESLLGKKSEKPDSEISNLKCGRSAAHMLRIGQDSTSLAIRVEKNYASIASEDKNAELSVSECTEITSKTSKNTGSFNYNKSAAKMPVSKELISLGVTENRPEFMCKDLRRRRDITNVRILFSQHLDDDVIRQQKKVAARLGISVVSCSMDATHFVADRFARTKNMLEAIARGKPVVTHLWLDSCGEANCFIDERNYILRDAKKERELGFCMPVSLARANLHPLLKGQRVLVTQNSKPDREMIMDLVKVVHGQLVEEDQIPALKDMDVTEELLILSGEEDRQICLPFLHKGAAVYSTELLLNGIVTQKLQYKRHQLFANDVNPSGIASSRSSKVDGFFR